MATPVRLSSSGPNGGCEALTPLLPVGCPGSSVQEVRHLQLLADVCNASECQDVVVAQIDAVACGGRKQRIQLVDREAGAVVGMRDIDMVIFGVVKIGDRDMAAIENEGVGAAEPGQGIVHVVAAKTAIKDVTAGVAGEVIAELRAEQVGDIAEGIGSRTDGILRGSDVEADCYSRCCMLIARGVVLAGLPDKLIVTVAAFEDAVPVPSERVVMARPEQDIEIR
jgi:hypothetical protein